MTPQEIKKKSKFLSLLLRHRPEKVGLVLDKNGWANVPELLSKTKISMDELLEIVINNDKQRFSFNEDKSKIRANQGHSLKQIDLELPSIVPPQFLYHGTVNKFMQSIRAQGLRKMNRQHVHLSKDRETAIKVGSRRGKAVILTIRAGDMHKDGFKFYCSKNGVWLTDSVPEKYINFSHSHDKNIKS